MQSVRKITHSEEPMKFRARVYTALLYAGIVSPTFAQNYPERPIRLIVAYPPGGGTDVTARTMVAKFSEGLGKQVVIDNRPGAGSTIGTDLVAKATPDGYTLLMSDTTLGIIPG